MKFAMELLRSLKNRGWIISLIYFSISAVQASILFEPYVNYEGGTIKATNSSSTDVGGKYTGTNFGARLGYRFSSPIFFAAEFSGMSGTFKPTASTTTSQTVSDSAVGGVLGFYHQRFEIYVGYAMTDDFIYKGASGATDTKLYGTSMKAGLEFLIYHHIALSFEYVVPNYTKVDLGSGTKAEISTAFTKYTPSVMRAGLSFPFDFGH